MQSRDAGQKLQFRSMYRGLFSAMAGSFPAAATFWYCADTTLWLRPQICNAKLTKNHVDTAGLRTKAARRSIRN